MDSFEKSPTQYESRAMLKNGEEVVIRPVWPTDEQLIVDFFNRLSPHSINLRFLRRLDVLPRELLHRFTHVDYNHEFALAGIVEEEGKHAIIATARYLYMPEDNLTELAVAVRDDWQHYGLGKLILQNVVEIGKENGISRFGGMIDPQNKIIMKILTDLGYEVKYFFRSGVFQVEIRV